MLLAPRSAVALALALVSLAALAVFLWQPATRRAAAPATPEARAMRRAVEFDLIKEQLLGCLQARALWRCASRGSARPASGRALRGPCARHCGGSTLNSSLSRSRVALTIVCENSGLAN